VEFKLSDYGLDVYEGNLTLVGSSSKEKGAEYWKYDLMEISGKVIHNVGVPEKLNNYISTALADEGDIKLEISGTLLKSIELSNGRIYFFGPGKNSLRNWILLGIVTIPLYGLGFIILLLILGTMGNRKRTKGWVAEKTAKGGIDLNP